MPCALCPTAYCPLPTATLPTLAQSGLDPRAFLYIGLLIILSVAGMMIIFAAKRRLLDDKDDENESGAGLMATLEAMLKRGEISREEYDLTRRKIIERAIENLDKAKTAPKERPEHPDLF